MPALVKDTADFRLIIESQWWDETYRAQERIPKAALLELVQALEDTALILKAFVPQETTH